MTEQSYRRNGARFCGAAALGFLALVAVVAFIPASPTARILVCLPGALVCGFFAVAAFREGVWSKGDDLVVRNLFRQYTVAWSEIEAIDPPPPGPSFWSRSGIRVYVADGRRINVDLYSAGRGGPPRCAFEVADCLRAELARRHPSTAAAADVRAPERLRARIHSQTGGWIALGTVIAILGGALIVADLSGADTHPGFVGTLCFIVGTAVALGNAHVRRKNATTSDARHVGQ